MVVVGIAAKPADAAFPGRNGDIAFSGWPSSPAQDQIFRMRSDGNGVRRLTNFDGFFTTPAYSPGGKKIAYARFSDDVTGDGDIYVMNSDGSGKVNITKSPNRNEGAPSFYPSGRRVVFVAAPFDGRFVEAELYAVSFNAAGQATGPPTRLTNNAFPDTSPVVSPDGTKIAWTSYRDGNSEDLGDSEIFVMNTGSPEGPANRAVRLTDNTADDDGPDFSPDGRRIVYSSDRSGNAEVVVMNADGSGKKGLTRNPESDGGAAFSPDGRMIAFVRYGSGQGAIWKMRADGTGQTKLTGNYEQLSGGVSWQPLP